MEEEGRHSYFGPFTLENSRALVDFPERG